MNVKKLGLEELTTQATKKINGGGSVSLVNIYGLFDGEKGNTGIYLFGIRIK